MITDIEVVILECLGFCLVEFNLLKLVGRIESIL
jgi:hypothetical protein